MTPTSADPGAAAATTGLFTTTSSEVPASIRAREYQLVGDRPTIDATTGVYPAGASPVARRRPRRRAISAVWSDDDSTCARSLAAALLAQADVFDALITNGKGE
jgi:hypothetical protein